MGHQARAAKLALSRVDSPACGTPQTVSAIILQWEE